MAGRLGKPEYILGVNRVGIRWQYVNWYIALFADFIAGIFDQEVTPELLEGANFVFKRFRTLYTNSSTPSSTEVWAGFTYGPSDIGVLEQYNFVWGFWVDVGGLKTARIPGLDSNTTFFDPGILFFTANAFSDTSAAFDATARLTAATDNGDGTVTAYRRFLGGNQLENTFVGIGPQVVNTYQAGADPQISQTFVFYTKPSSTIIWYRVQQENFNVERAALNLNRDFTLRDKETRGNKIRLYGEFTDVDPAMPFMVETEPYDLDVFVQDDFDTTDLTVENTFGLVSGIYFENAALSGNPPILVDSPTINSSGLLEPELLEVDITEFLIGEYVQPIVQADISGIDNILFDGLPELVSGLIEPIVVFPQIPFEQLSQISGAVFLQGDYFRNLLEFDQDSETIFIEDDEFTPLDGDYVEVVNDPSAFVPVEDIEVVETVFISGVYFPTFPLISGTGDDNELIEVDFSNLLITPSNLIRTVIIVGDDNVSDSLEVEQVNVIPLSGNDFASGEYFSAVQNTSGIDEFNELIQVPILPQTLESFYLNNQVFEVIDEPDTLLISGTGVVGETEIGISPLESFYVSTILVEEFEETIAIASGIAEPFLQQYFQSVILITGGLGFEDTIAITSGVAVLNDSLYEEVVVEAEGDDTDQITFLAASGFELIDSFYGLITDEGNPASDGEADIDTIAVSGILNENFAAMISGITFRVVEQAEVDESLNNVATTLYSGAFNLIVLPADQINEELEVQTELFSGVTDAIVIAADPIQEELEVLTTLSSGISTAIVINEDINDSIEVSTDLLSGVQIVDVAQFAYDEDIEVNTNLISGVLLDIIIPNIISDNIEVDTNLISGIAQNIILDASGSDTIEAITALISGSQTNIVSELTINDNIEVNTNLISGISSDIVSAADPISEALETLTILTSGNFVDVREFTTTSESIEVSTIALSGAFTVVELDPDEIVIETLLGNYLIYSGVIL